MVVRDVCGLTGLAIIADICNGNLDPNKLTEHRHGNCKKSFDEIAKALKGNNRKRLPVWIEQEYDSYLFFKKKYTIVINRSTAFLKFRLTLTL